MSVGLSGKLALIAITVTAMVGGFGLGYFVARNAPEPAVQPVAQVVPLNPPGPDARAAKEEVKPQDSPPLSAGQTPATDNGRTTGRGAPAEEQRPATSPVATAAEAPPVSNRSVDPKAQNDPVYTVQVGAFKSRREADALKTDLEGKGLKAWRQKVGQKDRPLYKVMVGEFREKKEAEVLALKLKKTEGLQAFVTVKN